MSMSITSEKSFKLKTGETIPSGLPVKFIEGTPSRCLVYGNRETPYRVRVTSAFRVPKMDELEEWAYDSVVNSVAGERVEPDGYDEHGSPSWLLVLGLI
jgi:hypothetical protein